MDNFARREFDTEINKKVKEELEIANIPYIRLPRYMDTEVKTDYIGLLNGFKFYRAWTYWVCIGDMPLDDANYIYENYRDLDIRAGGHCGNVEPETQSYNPVYDAELSKLLKSVGIKEYMEKSKEIVDDKSLPRFVRVYHVDTELGLCKLAKTIIERDIHTEIKND